MYIIALRMPLVPGICTYLKVHFLAQTEHVMLKKVDVSQSLKYAKSDHRN